MARQRDPNRDKAKEMFISSGGKLALTEISAQLGIPDGTVRGWKAKDKWDNLLTGGVKVTELSVSKKIKRNVTPEDKEKYDGAEDDLFIPGVRIVAEAKQASVYLLQRRLRIGHTRASSLIDSMERKKLVGPYQGDKPREVYATSETVKVLEQEYNVSERNAPKTPSERSANRERSKINRIVPIQKQEEEPEIPEVPDNEGLTPKQRIFVMEYLRDFNATRAAMASGYSKKTAHSIGWENLRKPEIKSAIRRYSEMFTSGLGLNIQRIINEYMKIAFSDMSDFASFGKEDMPLFNKKGAPVLNEDGSQMTQAVSFVDLKNDSEVDGTIISEVKQGKDGVSVKLYDKMRALKELEKYLGYMSDIDKLKVEKLRLEVDKLKNGDEDSDDLLIEDWVNGVMDIEE